MRSATLLFTLLYACHSMTTTAAVVAPLEPCLYPHESETREVRSLDGLWSFVRSNQTAPTQGITERWFDDDLRRTAGLPAIAMPVPASYNDVTVDAALRDHVGTVWYDRRFFVPHAWSTNRRVWLRFGSVHYDAIVWVNGRQVARHEIGHLPFQADVTEALAFGTENRVTVLCDNTLRATTVPQGQVSEVASDVPLLRNGKTLVQSYTFDFFNYAGIERSVHLYTTPVVHIKSVRLNTDVLWRQQRSGNNNASTGTPAPDGRIDFEVAVANDLLAEALHNENATLAVRVQVRDRAGALVASAASTPGAPSSRLNGSVVVPEAHLWWPYLMAEEPGYSYTVEVQLVAMGIDELVDGVALDVYRLKAGIRTVRWTAKELLINERPVYMRGFGRHEDSDIRGKGLDLALLTRDFDLLRWVGANAYRTSHYPYSEESMQFADEAGIMVINECPSVDTDIFSAALLHKHKRSLEELIVRDRNHASVIMWSIANEPRTQHAAADAYFGEVARYTRSLDATRPVTAAIAQPLAVDRAARHLDIIGFNRYNGWYSNPGRLDMITGRVVAEARAWHAKHGKPVMMLEYGADTMEGLHTLPSFVWTEDYQEELFARHFRAFDVLQQQEGAFFVGEFIWNFADFKTGQAYTRVGGNKKGIFTRARQPKAAAKLVRQRYHQMAFAEANGTVACAAMPADLELYTYDGAVAAGGLAALPRALLDNNELFA